MSKTNCINCGAAKDTSELKCPFCGTTYLDLTAIDFSSGDPVVCQFVLPDEFRLSGHERRRVVMSMLAIPRLECISQEANTVDVYGGNTRLFSFIDSYELNVGVSFKPVSRPDDKTLFTLKAKEENE